MSKLKAILIDPVIIPIVEHRKILNLPGSPTGRLVNLWAKVMVIPQFLAPLTILFGRIEGPLIFLARYLAMYIVYLLDKRIPFTRALGLCHLLTFGPLFVWFTLDFADIYRGWGVFGFLFVVEYIVIAVCLFQDLRDLILHALGRPYPCYVRDYHRLGHISIDDERVEQPVTPFSTFLW